GASPAPAPRPHEHVHRPGEERPFRDRRELGGHRPGRGAGAVRRGVRPGTDSVVSPSGRMHEMSVPSPVNEKLLSQRLGALGSARSWAPNVLPEFERFIRTADDYDLFRVNPIQYGGLVNRSEADAIE